MDPDTLPSAERIDPERLTVLLEEAGWRLVGGRRGIYNRLASPHLVDDSGFRGGLVVPLDKSAPEYSQLMKAAVEDISGPATRDLWQRLIEPRITIETADQFQFRRESPAPAGLIAWPQGEDLYRSVRLTLTAGAKSYVKKMRRYSNTFGQFSSRFLESVFMGQTAIGSFIVTAYAPTDTSIPVYSTNLENSAGSQIARGREITNSVATALEATVEALEHFHRTASLSGFEDGVRRGISHELSVALEEFTTGSDGSDINIAWEDADLMGRIPSSRFEFTSRDAPALSRAAIYLAKDVDEVHRETVVGRVHLLSKSQLGEPGIFGLASISPPFHRLRVNLSNQADYRQAVKAHNDDTALAVNGELVKDGNRFSLRDAVIVLSEVPIVNAPGNKIPDSGKDGTLPFENTP